VDDGAVRIVVFTEKGLSRWSDVTVRLRIRRKVATKKGLVIRKVATSEKLPELPFRQILLRKCGRIGAKAKVLSGEFDMTRTFQSLE
jgi:hypothetical protein